MYGNNQWDIGTLILKFWFLNSVGSECNPYKVEVVGSNPTGTTQCLSESWAETM